MKRREMRAHEKAQGRAVDVAAAKRAGAALRAAMKPRRWTAEIVNAGDDPLEDNPRWMVTEGSKIIAECRQGLKADRRNAPLLAAAPELAEALRGVVDHFARSPFAHAAALVAARAALAKVTP